MAHSDGGAPPARRRRMPIGDAAPPSLAPAPSVGMGPGNGGAPTARRRRRRRRKPTGTAGPPSLVPPPYLCMTHGDEGTPPERKRKGSSLRDGQRGKRGRRTNSNGSSSGNGSAGGHGHQVKADTGSLAGEDEILDDLAGCCDDDPNGSGAVSADQTHGSPDALDAVSALSKNVEKVNDDNMESSAGEDVSLEDLSPQRKRKGSSLPRHARVRGTDPLMSSSRNSSGGGHGESSDGTERSEGEDPAGEDLAGGQGGDPIGSTERSQGEDLAGGQGGEPNGSGASGASLAAHRKIVVAHTANTPPRFEGFIKSITSLIPYEDKGKSYECSLGRMNAFLKWSKAENAFFFEWNDDKLEMTCWIHNIKKGHFFKFTVNAAFSVEMGNLSVERAAVAFSTNFVGNGEYWSNLKDTLLNMFGSFEDNGLKDYDYLYVFTRVGDSICFRNFKITSLPTAGVSSRELVLREINTTFSLKLVDDQVTPNSSDIGAHLTKNETLRLGEVTLYISNGQMGSCLSHCVDFSGTAYSILLENGIYLSSLEKLEGFNTSLVEIVEKEPFLKMKHIIGSKTNKTHCFARQRCKSILQSLFAEVATLFESGKCISETSPLLMHNVLVRGTDVRLYGVFLTDYTDYLATINVGHLVDVVKQCFPTDTIPLDLEDLLQDLDDYPLDAIRTAKDDCSLLKAKERWMLLININSEFMTNVEEKPAEPDQISEITFFNGCPNEDDWDEIMKDNEYMLQVCNVETSDQESGEKQVGKSTASIKKSAEKKKLDSNKDKNVSVIRIMEKKKKVAKKTASIKKFAKKKKMEYRGTLQFCSKRNFLMHMPEKAKKDGIIPFRLGMADYILTAYFPRFLRFVQKRMRDVKAQRGIKAK